MITYKIYEIPMFIQPDGSIGKVGCTSQTIEQRAKEQSYSDVYLLEEHTDIYEASNRELEIQAEKGYLIDDVPYHISIKNRRKWTREDALKGGATRALQLKDGIQSTELWANHTVEERQLRCDRISKAHKSSDKAKAHRKNLHASKLKFSWDIAEEIRNKYLKGGWYHRTLAKEYNCSAYAISCMLSYKTYCSPNWTP